MKRLLSVPLRVLLPALLLSCAAIAGLISWQLNTRLLAGEIEAQFLDDARLRLTSLQATLEYHARKGDANGVDLAVAETATRNDVIAAYVLDPEDRILAATRNAAIGNAAETIAADLPADLKARHALNIAQVRASTHGCMELSQDRRVAVAYYPLVVHVDDHALRTVRNGLVVLVLDTQMATARAFRAAGRQALDNALVFGGLAACAWVFLHLSLTRRVARLVATTRQLASGNLAARTGIEGSDELAQVAKAFDLMADRIAEDTRELATSLSVQNATLDSTADGILAVDFAGKVVCYNAKFASMWGIPSEMLEKRDSNEMVDFVVSQVRRADQFMKRIEELYRSRGAEAFDVIELKDGRTFERYIQPQRVGGENVGMVANFRDVTERKRADAELVTMHRELQEISRRAGMAEVASSVLHNVGNVLNSVNTSMGVATEKVSRLKAGGLARIATLLNEHAENLPAFFAEHPQGVRLPKFVTQLAEHFTTEQKTVLEELASLRGNLEHINAIVALQQDYAGAGGVIETLPLAEVIEDALRMNAVAFERHGTQIVRELDSELPPMSIDRNKLLLILVNLVRNAKYACDDGESADKRITVRAGLNGGDYAKISVSDNGIGIPAANLTRIFEHGFTTRKTGHGFGLHSSALAASEMGGSLSVHSDGPGRGATFTIELPVTHS